MSPSKDAESQTPDADDGRYVQRGKRFDAKHDPGARVIRAGEKATAQRLKAAGASDASADWGGAAGQDPDEPDPAALGFDTPDKDATANASTPRPVGKKSAKG